jgi:hypothetical protein
MGMKDKSHALVVHLDWSATVSVALLKQMQARTLALQSERTR